MVCDSCFLTFVHHSNCKLSKKKKNILSSFFLSKKEKKKESENRIYNTKCIKYPGSDEREAYPKRFNENVYNA